MYSPVDFYGDDGDDRAARAAAARKARIDWLRRKEERQKEEMYLDRIATLMDTRREKLDTLAKIKLWEDGVNYQKVVKYVNNSQAHPNIKLTVVNIHRVWRRADDLKLIDPNRKLLWHGTKRTNIPQILETGFRLPNSNSLMFGTGIYFADRITKSANYSDQDKTFLLLCEVALGKVYSCAKSHNDLKGPPIGFDSVKGNGTYVPDWTDNGHYMAMHIPYGKTAKCTKYDAHAVLYNEFIVYDPKKIIIRFLVEVKVERVTSPPSLTLVVPTNSGQQTGKPTGKQIQRKAATATTGFRPTATAIPKQLSAISSGNGGNSTTANPSTGNSVISRPRAVYTSTPATIPTPSNGNSAMYKPPPPFNPFFVTRTNPIPSNSNSTMSIPRSFYTSTLAIPNPPNGNSAISGPPTVNPFAATRTTPMPSNGNSAVSRPPAVNTPPNGNPAISRPPPAYTRSARVQPPYNNPNPLLCCTIL